MIENYITSTGISISSIRISTSPTGISVRQSPHTDILVLVQEPPFTDSQHKEINRLLKKGIFIVIVERRSIRHLYIQLTLY